MRHVVQISKYRGTLFNGSPGNKTGKRKAPGEIVLRERTKSHTNDPDFGALDLRHRNLGAERTAAAAGALDVRIVELKARTINRFDVIDLHAIEVHLAHLVDEHFQ